MKLKYEDKTYELHNGDIIGREKGSSIQILDVPGGSTVSRKHARIEQEGKNYFVVDLNSKNGTYVNGEKITRGLLDIGNVVHFGDLEMEVVE